MRLFPNIHRAEVYDLSPQVIFAGLVMATKGSCPVEARHVTQLLSGPIVDSQAVETSDVQQLLKLAEKRLHDMGFEHFVRAAAVRLDDKQKMAVLVNLMDLCVVENSLIDGEHGVFSAIREAFAVPEEALRPYMDMLELKNDNSLRLNTVPAQYKSAAAGFRALV